MNLKYLHCVPCFNNPKTIQKVTRDLLEHSALDILIIDDGSDLPVSELLKNETQNPRIHLIRMDQNKGKGNALRIALKWALDNNYTHLISSDADDQHPATEVIKVYQKSLEYPLALIIGLRNMDTENVPGISHFGRKFSNFWVKYQTDLKISDSQSGLRCYPIIQLQNESFFTKRFDFEIEVLIRMIWNNVSIIEVPVSVLYQKAKDRVSHFDKFWDNLRITLLNTLLIIISLLKEQSSPLKLSLAFGIGVFIGCTPFYGLHAFFCAATSFFSRLNFLGLLAGSQISLPFFVPFLVAGAKFLGDKTSIDNSFLSFFAGSSFLGLILGSLSFLISFLILKKRENSLKETEVNPWKVKQRGGRLGNTFLKLVMVYISPKLCYLFVAIFVVPYFYLFNSKARKGSYQYWKTLYPEDSFLIRQGRIFKHMYVYATSLIDSVNTSIRGEKAVNMRSSGYEELLKTLALNKGLMLLTGHCGAFYLASRALGRHHFPHDVYIVRYEGQGLTFADLQEKALAPKEIIVNSEALPTLEIRKALMNSSVVSVMGDRPLGTRLELFKFLGKWVVLDLSLYRTAMACEAPLFYGFGFKESKDSYVFTVGHIYAKNKNQDRDEHAKELAKCFLKTLEDYVRIYPYQWFNWYDYFSVDKKLFLNNSRQATNLKSTPHKSNTKEADKSSVSLQNI